jgi:hypothetical protein
MILSCAAASTWASHEHLFGREGILHGECRGPKKVGIFRVSVGGLKCCTGQSPMQAAVVFLRQPRDKTGRIADGPKVFGNLAPSHRQRSSKKSLITLGSHGNDLPPYVTDLKKKSF